jgi:hypothetical protein
MPRGPWRYLGDSSRSEVIMGKYVLGWLLGVPVVVLVVIYLLFN